MADVKFSGISSEDCDQFIREVEGFAGQVIGDRIVRESASIIPAIQQFQAFRAGDFYLNQSKVADLREPCERDHQLFEHPFYNDAFVPDQLKAFAADFKSFVDPNSPPHLNITPNLSPKNRST